jgi:hypothetical protein
MTQEDVRSEGPSAGMFIAFILECIALMMICVVLWEIYDKISEPAEQAMEIHATVTNAMPQGLSNTGLININDAQATSELYQSDDIDNSPYAACDGYVESSWQEGTEGEGYGERIEFYFSEAKVRYVRLELGNWRSENRYYTNNRPKTMTVDIGGDSYQVEFEDDMISQYIVFSEPITASDISFTIDDIYMGQTHDCCISEVTIYEG